MYSIIASVNSKKLEISIVLFSVSANLLIVC